jgi:hypothetical protein
VDAGHSDELTRNIFCDGPGSVIEGDPGLAVSFSTRE